MAADLTRVKKRVSEILNFCDAATYSTTGATYNKLRNATAISDAVDEAALTILREIAMSVQHPDRNSLMVEITVAHNDFISSVGPPDNVLIQPFSGAPFMPALTKNASDIEQHRVNQNNVHGDTPHNEANSDGNPSHLAGFYNITDANRVGFTGYACKMRVARVARADVATKVPDYYENTVVCLAVTNCPKSGDAIMDIVSHYQSKANNDIARIPSGVIDVDPMPGDEG